MVARGPPGEKDSGTLWYFQPTTGNEEDGTTQLTITPLAWGPNDRAVLTKLVDVYKRQGDVPHAVEAQQEIVAAETDPDARLSSLIELARIHENVGRDPRPLAPAGRNACPIYACPSPSATMIATAR